MHYRYDIYRCIAQYLGLQPYLRSHHDAMPVHIMRTSSKWSLL
jgi:hypothetical protein